MDSFQEALSRYQNDAGSLARGALQGNEAGLRAKASMVSMKESAIQAKAGFDFTKKVTGERDETTAGSEIGEGGMIGAPAILKAGSALAGWRSSSLATKWKSVNASRQRVKDGPQEQDTNQPSEADFPEGEHPGMETPQPAGDATRTGKIGNIEVSKEPTTEPTAEPESSEPTAEPDSDFGDGMGRPPPMPRSGRLAGQASQEATQAESQATTEASQAESQATSEADTAGASANQKWEAINSLQNWGLVSLLSVLWPSPVSILPKWVP